MSKDNKNGRRIVVRGVRRDPPDVKKLSRALIALALEQAQAEANAQAVHDQQAEGSTRDEQDAA